MKLLSWRERVDAFKRAHWFYRIAAPLLSAAYLAGLRALNGLHAEHLIAVVGLCFLAFWSDSTRRWSKVILPVVLYGAVYDSMRYYADLIRSPTIHIREPYEFDQRWFGIREGGRVLTPPEYWQLHTNKVLDFVTGMSYFVLFFVGESIALSLYFFGTGREKRALRFIWIFVVTNFLGFSLYYIYPAAPPWYVSDHGFALDLSVRASGAGALRFDQLVGLPLMAGFYGKSADVFGAIPSLHVAYPFIAAVYGWPLKRFRWVGVGYFLLICFSAMYLNHHYVLDMMVGVGLSLLAMAIFRLAGGPLEAREAQAAAAAAAAAAEPKRELATP
jgi:membrane-associated phospholipid phosphatase